MLIDSFHDWYINGILIDGDILRLSVREEKSRRDIAFSGVSRCLVNDFLVQNIIYDIKILDRGSEKYNESVSKLNETYPWPPKEHKNIAFVNPSVGAEIIIEFSEVHIEDKWR